MSYTIRPLYDKCVVKETKLEHEKRKSVIIEAEPSKDYKHCVVVAATSQWETPLGHILHSSIKVGDTVTVPLSSGTRVVIDGETFYIYSQPQLLAVLEHEPEPSTQTEEPTGATH